MFNELTDGVVLPVGPSGLLGLDYNAVRWVMELQRIADPLAVLDDLQTIEARVVEIVNERRD